MPRIVLTGATGSLAGRRFEHDATVVTIGRRAGHDVEVPEGDSQASADHCELRFDGRQWQLRDLGSTNGTLLRGQRLEGTAPVATGALIQLGPAGSTLMVQLEDRGGYQPALPPPGTRTGPAATEAQPPITQPGSVSSGRTAYYMALVGEKVGRSSRGLKVMIALLALVLVGGGVAAGLVISHQADKTEQLESDLQAQQKKLALAEKRIKAARKSLTSARKKLAKTSGKLTDLRLKMSQVDGEAKTELAKQAKSLEASRRKYEEQLRKQESALSALRDDSHRAEKIARDAERGLFMLIAPGPGGEQFGFCTAFAVDAKGGWLATNAHCLAVLRELKSLGRTAVARMNKNPDRTYPIVAFHGHSAYGPLFSADVAAVQVRLPPGQRLPVALKLAPTAKVRDKLASGQAIYTMGFPGKVMNERRPAADFRAAVISRLTSFDNDPGTAQSRRMVWHSALTSKGTSGSPIFDADGEVIAVNTGGLGSRTLTYTDPTTGRARSHIVYDATGLNFGVRVDALREVLAASGVTL